jgi:hypothetical protein
MAEKKGRPKLNVKEIIEKPEYMNIFYLLSYYAGNDPPIELKHLAVALCKKTVYDLTKKEEYVQFFNPKMEIIKKYEKAIQELKKKKKHGLSSEEQELMEDLMKIKSIFSFKDLDRMLERGDFGDPIATEHKFGSYSSLRDHINILLALGLIEPVSKTSYKLTQKWHEGFWLHQIHYYADRIPTEKRMSAFLYLRSLCKL